MDTALPQFDPALIARYDVAGPRYTSYPAAPQFHSDFGESAWRGFVQAHYVMEPRRRKRPESFRPLVDRFGNAASVSTEKKRGRGAGDV